MAEVSGLTAGRMLQIEEQSIVDGHVDANGDLILTRYDGTLINAGNVKGPQGDPAPPVPDTGWLDYEGFATGFTSYDEAGYKVRYRKVGDTVHWKGLFKRTGSPTPVLGSGNVIVGTIPVGFQPPSSIDFVQPTSATGTFGRVIFEAEATATDRIIAQNGTNVTWMGINGYYILD